MVVVVLLLPGPLLVILELPPGPEAVPELLALGELDVMTLPVPVETLEPPGPEVDVPALVPV